jgi:hypothetical protein
MSKLMKTVLYLGILGSIFLYSPFIMAMSPTAPMITQLPPEIYTTSVTISWSEATSNFGIYRYFVQKSTDSSFSSDVTIMEVGNTLNYTFADLSYNTFYYFRVYAQGIDLNPSNMNPWDPVTNPNGVRWSAVTRTRCIPIPVPNTLDPPVISEISPGIYHVQDDTYYTNSRNPVISWTTPNRNRQISSTFSGPGD